METMTGAWRKLRMATMAAMMLAPTCLINAQKEITVNLEDVRVRAFLNNIAYDYSSLTRVTGYATASDLKKPTPAVITLQQPATGITLVRMTNTENENDNYTAVAEEGSQEVEVYNLIPKQRYAYQVVQVDEEGNEDVLDEGFVNTQGRLRMMWFESIFNMRDLGGWKIDGGQGTTQYGLLYRGSALRVSNVASDEDLAELRRLGIMAELETRKMATEPTEAAIGPDAEFLYLGLDDKWEGFVPVYNNELKQAFEFVVDNLRKKRAVYFHCSVGADRTGVMAALIEGCIGVSASDVYKDYELSSFSSAKVLGLRYKQHLNNRIITHLGYTDGGDLKECTRNYMINEMGISEQDIEDLTDIMSGSYQYDDAEEGEQGPATGIAPAFQQPDDCLSEGYSPDRTLPVRFTDLSGRRLAAPCRGISIRRASDGTTHKLLR